MLVLFKYINFIFVSKSRTIFITEHLYGNLGLAWLGCLEVYWVGP